MRVQSGFSEALDAIWSENPAYERSRKKPAETLSEYLKQQQDNVDRLWLTGHSLGGALATITAARIYLSDDAPFKKKIEGLITIGSPRALNFLGAENLAKGIGRNKIFRIQRSLDIVPLIPRIGYKHVEGPRCVVGNGGQLVVGARNSRWVMDGFATLTCPQV